MRRHLAGKVLTMSSSDRAPEIVLIDAFSQIFRAFFAIRELVNSRGEPVNALFVFTRLLLTLEREYPTDSGAMLFDCGKVDFRLAVAPDYKANRPPLPDALGVQLPRIDEMAAAFGWPLLRYENFEADDLIGGFCRACSGRRIAVITSDKDLAQLIDDRVTLLAPAARGFETRDREWTLRKFGVAPELIADYLALTGDHVDNIPGIPGIGPKSAAEILNRFGALDCWLEHPQETLAGTKYASKFPADASSLLRRNLALTQLRTELPEEFRSADVLRRNRPDWKRVRELCDAAEFRSLLREIPEEEASCESESGEEADLFAAASAPEAPAPKDGDAAGGFVQGELF